MDDDIGDELIECWSFELREFLDSVPEYINMVLQYDQLCIAD